MLEDLFQVHHFIAMDISENYHTITILEAIHSIESRNFRLPAIQRKFVWQPAQILALFCVYIYYYIIDGTFFSGYT